MKLQLLTAAMTLVVLSPACTSLVRAQEATPGQEAPQVEPTPEPPAPAGEQAAPAPPGHVPLGAVDPPIYAIPDIRAHRGAELSYVRRAADLVKVELGTIDFSADPVLSIGGRPVSQNEYRRRALMYAGGNEIDKHVTHLLTQHEIDRQVADFTATLRPDDAEKEAKLSAYTSNFELSPTAVDRKFEEYKELLAQQSRQGAELKPGDPDPGVRAIEEFEASINSSIGMEAYRQLLAADAAFEKVFMPFPEGKVEGVAHDMANGPPPLDEPRPDWMPQASWDALGSDDQGRNLRSFVKAWAIDGTGVPGMFKPSILARVRDGLVAQAGVAYFFDEELPDDAFMRIGEQMVPINDIWYLVENKLCDVDNELIVRELLTLDAMNRSLTAAGRWLDKDAFAKVWYDHEQEYVGTLFPLKNIILFRGYTSLDRYREHYRYREAYNLWRKSTLTDEEVLEHYQGGGRLFFERGNAVVDIAYDPIGERPFNGDTLAATHAELASAMADARAAWAQEQAEAALEADEGAEPAAAARDRGPGDAAWFARVSRQFPPPATPQGGDSHHFQRSQLRMQLTEDELSIFLTGYSLADDLFYHGQKGDVFGPWTEACRRHAWGAEANAATWGVAIKDFVRSGPVGAFEGRAKDLAYEDFLDLNYFFWAQEGLRALLPSVKVAPTAR